MSKLIYNHVKLDHLWHFNTLQKIQNKAVDDLYIYKLLYNILKFLMLYM